MEGILASRQLSDAASVHWSEKQRRLLDVTSLPRIFCLAVRMPLILFPVHTELHAANQSCVPPLHVCVFRSSERPLCEKFAMTTVVTACAKTCRLRADRLTCLEAF